MRDSTVERGLGEEHGLGRTDGTPEFTPSG